MKSIGSDRVQIRVRIEGKYIGIPFIYEDPINSDGSQFIWINGSSDDNPNSEYWWRDGNMACDCNRCAFLPTELREQHSGDCGHDITIHKIIPLEGDFPILIVDGHSD